jgi:DNA-binding NarL/FixJ family response regulator
MTIRTLICDDHDLVRTAIARVLDSDPGLQVVGEESGAEALWRALRTHPAPDLLLLDLNLDAGGVAAGIALLDRLRVHHPTLPVVVLTMHDEPELVARVLRGGARGFVAKGSPMEVLREAITQVHRGRRFVDPGLVDGLLDAPDGGREWDHALTPREREVMARLCAGQRLSEIAAALSLSIKTVSTHKMRLMDKLEVRNNAELIRLGQKHGLV